MGYANHDKTTCTACAGTLLLEFAALSRLTGNPEFEVKAHRAMEFIWQKRHQGHNLVGTTINIHNGEWTRKESGVGAGIDSYYEYCLKSYILLGQPEYLRRFEKVRQVESSLIATFKFHLFLGGGWEQYLTLVWDWVLKIYMYLLILHNNSY